MATGWNVMDALNNKTKAAAEDNKTKARFRTKDIAIKQMYSNGKIMNESVIRTRPPVEKPPKKGK